MISEEEIVEHLQSFQTQYSDLFLVLDGISKIEYQLEPEAAFIIYIGEKIWVEGLIPARYRGIKIYKKFV